MAETNGWPQFTPASAGSILLPVLLDIRERIGRLEGAATANTQQIMARLERIEARVYGAKIPQETMPSTAQASTIFSRLGVSPLEAAALTLAVALGLSGVLAPGDMRAILLALLGAKP